MEGKTQQQAPGRMWVFFAFLHVPLLLMRGEFFTVRCHSAHDVDVLRCCRLQFPFHPWQLPSVVSFSFWSFVGNCPKPQSSCHPAKKNPKFNSVRRSHVHFFCPILHWNICRRLLLFPRFGSLYNTSTQAQHISLCVCVPVDLHHHPHHQHSQQTSSNVSCVVRCTQHIFLCPFPSRFTIIT